MLLIDCPYCGRRPELEFTYGGEAHLARPANPGSLSDEAWAEFLYMRTNPKGLHAERWRHTHGCARFFNALRDTVSDMFLATYKIGEQRPDLAPGVLRDVAVKEAAVEEAAAVKQPATGKEAA
jgi:sarcosine oxidase subunit delta